MPNLACFLPPCSKYYGATPSEVVTPLAAVRLALPGAAVTWGGDANALKWTDANEKADVARCQAAVGGGQRLLCSYSVRPAI